MNRYTPGGTTNIPGLTQAGMRYQIPQPKQTAMDWKPLSGIGDSISQGSLSYTPSWNGSTPSLNQQLGQTNAMKTTDINNVADFGVDAFNSNMNNDFGLSDVSLGDIFSIGGTLMNAYNIYNNVQMQKDYMDMAKEQLGMAKEQWGMTKDEVNRIGKVRNNLNTGYATGNYGASPTSKTNY